MEHHHSRHDHGTGSGQTDLAEILELETEALQPYLSGVIDWTVDQVTAAPRRIVDLGCGTGAGALALAQRFGGADVTAVDVSASMLGRLQAKARERGLAGRIRTLQADLDAGWPAVGLVDLVWASNSLHHVKDPDQVLAGALAALRPGGLLAVAEMDSFPRFLPDGIGPGLEGRLRAILDELRASEMPHLGSDWGPRLSSAGFVIEARRTFTIDQAGPLPAAGGRFAQAALMRLRSGLDGHLSAADLATLGTLLDSDGPQSVLRRDDLSIRAARTVWAARRP